MRVSFLALSCLAWFGFAVKDDGQTNIAQKLNARIAASDSQLGTYRGKHNKGVMVRTPDFLSQISDDKVLPATFWHNDIYAPSQMYPTVSDPFCPNSGWDGYTTNNKCTNDENGPWMFAGVAVVMADSMQRMWDNFNNIQDDNWSNGVFYASDANAADSRCVYLVDKSGWDCPGGWIDSDGSFTADDHKGSGSYEPGNPDTFGGAGNGGGGGSGCHYDSGAIDQPDAFDSNGNNLVQDANCQCNYAFKDDWSKWVETWTSNTQQKAGFENRHWLDGSGSKAPAWGLDTAACWMNNPRDMIELQNALFWQRASWNNQLIPQSDWSQQSSEELRKYWGWNEIPVAKWIVNDPEQWDAIIIKLPADVCNGDLGAHDDPSCLSPAAKDQLENDLDQFVNTGKLVLGLDNMGSRPGSYILFVREFGSVSDPSAGRDMGVRWSREFFCSSWKTPNEKYEVIYAKGACYIDHVHSPAPQPPPTPPSPQPSPDPSQAGIIKHSGERGSLCLDLADEFPHPEVRVIPFKCGPKTPPWFLQEGRLVYAGPPNPRLSDQQFCAARFGRSIILKKCRPHLDGGIIWAYDNDRLYHNDLNLCVSLILRRPPRLGLQTCSGGASLDPMQQWSFSGPALAIHNASAAATPRMMV